MYLAAEKRLVPEEPDVQAGDPAFELSSSTMSTPTGV
jgi:hypothetical protein